MSKPKVFLAPAGDYARTLREALAWLAAEPRLKQAGGIFLKPNLTYPSFRPGVTTTPEMLEAALEVFSGLNDRVVVGESDGGYGSFSIEQAFQGFKLHELGRRYGVAVVNLSREPVEECRIPTRLGPVCLGLPRFLLREGFVTVTLPVPKVHCMTGVSLSFKNQWGCIPDMMRLRFHYFFNDLIGPINRLLNVQLSVMDGTYGLTKNGPIAEGEVVRPGWLLVGEPPGATDRVAAHLMGLSLEDYPHYRRIKQTHALPILGEIETNRDPEPFRERTPQFYLKRHIWNRLAKTTWYSRRWCYLVYESRAAGLLHKIMYTFRERPKDFQAYED